MENMYDDIFLILLNNFPGIENIIENAKDYYEKLDNFDNYTLTEKFVIFNEALHVAHYSGSMISDYINLNDVDADFLDEMSDRDVSDWNDELGELGIRKYKENNK